MHEIVAPAIGVVAVQPTRRRSSSTETRNEHASLSRRSRKRPRSPDRDAPARRLLRVTDESAPLHPRSGLPDLARLIDEAERSGLPVTLEVVGEPLPQPATLAVTEYRISIGFRAGVPGPRPDGSRVSLRPVRVVRTGRRAGAWRGSRRFALIERTRISSGERGAAAAALPGIVSAR